MSYRHFDSLAEAEQFKADLIEDGFIAYILRGNAVNFDVRFWASL